MSKPIDDQVVAPLKVPALHSHSHSPLTSSAGSIVPSCSAPHAQIVASTHSATSHVPSSYYREPLATLSGSLLGNAVRSFRHWRPWSTHNHPGSSMPCTEELTVKAPSSSPYVNGGSDEKADGKMLDVVVDNHSANFRAAPFSPGHKELASLALRFKAEGSRSAVLSNQSGCQNVCGDPGVSVGSECHFDTGGADTATKRKPDHSEAAASLYPAVTGVGMFDPVAHIPPRAHTTSSAYTCIHNLKASAHGPHANIMSLVRLKDNNAVRHRSLILGVTRDGMPNCSLRIDRFRDHTLSLVLFGLRRGKSNALDMVTMSGDSNLLHDVRSSEEALLDLLQPVPLLEFGRVFEVVLGECGSYDVFAENCWFMVSILEELFVEMFGARYVKGGARRSRLARQTRARIRSRLGLGDSE
ncbi:uncharacterized protein EI90DRAFT_3035615 [Cantharellus anzutake]|uniref:uncharacterized protein n=1 Tax=Cantharellus anzutake TaxID=1750568 RepID=UPI001907B7B7|nr:uncharacterized protein EI90DRAFT_3035615 [Cantharellus anzutake]KAF8340456.1 hypothetical protein EI90DRAFT_3035615 [Cantharellus anzutake]